jgi:hypothetical protein
MEENPIVSRAELKDLELLLSAFFFMLLGGEMLSSSISRN